jgi:short subunit dehydrogenase-like uncharacterized protein
MVEAMDWADRDFDVVVYGASGFTGRLVADYLHRQYGADGEVRWAVAGRDTVKLQAVLYEIGAGNRIKIIQAQTSDPASLLAMAQQAKVILTTVGPYPTHGGPLIEACLKTGTDTVDLNGDPVWLADMIRLHGDAAQAAGVRFVGCCGFDCIPSDFGVFLLQQHMRDRYGAPAARVRGRVRKMVGAMSGGTAASMLAMMEAVARDPAIAKVTADPFALTPGFTGPPQPPGDRAIEDPDGNWVAPFVMAMINTKLVHRTNFLLGQSYGRDFVYDEMVVQGPGDAGRRKAKAAARTTMVKIPAGLARIAPLRWLIKRVLPKPGEGPSKAQREAGSFELAFTANAPDGTTVTSRVTGDKDPGYGSTCGMIAESALCLAFDTPKSQLGGGFWTPVSAFGDTLVKRLEARAGLTFGIEPLACARPGQSCGRGRKR